MTRHGQTITVFCLTTVLILGSGCQLWRQKSTNLADRVGLRMRPLGTPNDAMKLEFVFAERSLNDPLIGSALWDRLDVIGRRPASVRTALALHGLRVGQVGGALPPALEELLALTAPNVATDESTGASIDNKEKLRGWRLYLRDGGETEVGLHDEPIEQITFTPPDQDDAREFTEVKFVLRITARRLADGWARLECLPEVHHGPRRMRYTATVSGWGFRTSQQILPLYALKFTVDLTVGEMAIMTSAPGAGKTSAGRMFFSRDATHPGLQRVLVVRLANMPLNSDLYTRIADKPTSIQRP